MFEDPATAWSTVYCLRPYNPYRREGAVNPAFIPRIDGRLLNFKDGVDEAIWLEIEEFKRGLDRLQLLNPTVLVIVPGHVARDSNEGRPLARVAHGLAALDRRYIPRVDMLIRTATIPQRSVGGARSMVENEASMRVNDFAGGSADTVILLDDTVTTGSTIAAARHLLTQAGARRVGAVALARTVKYYGSIAAGAR